MRRHIVRGIYIAILICFFGWLVNTFVSGWAYTWGEGMVVGYPATVAVEYASTVQELFVVEGQKVVKGQVIATTSSQIVAAERARLTGDAATRALKWSDLHTRNRIVTAMLAAAEAREKTVETNQAQLNTVDKNAVSILTKNASAEAVYRGKLDAETLRVEKSALEHQIETARIAIKEANDALASLSYLYDNGVLRAPVDGFVTKLLVSPGSVAKSGDPLIELVGHERFVLAYFNVGRFFHLYPGRSVTITTGNATMLSGKVARVDVIAGALPREFQGQLVPTERKQLVRIDFDEGQEIPPYFTKVSVR